MIKATLTLTILLNFHAFAGTKSIYHFSSLKSPEKSLNLKEESLKKALFIAHDCHACHELLKKLKKKCSSLDATVFAVGDKTNLQPKLKILKKLGVLDKVYTGSTTQAYADIGIDLIPYFISSKGEKFESGVYNGMVTDGACKLKKKN